MGTLVKQRRFTAKEYHRMAKAGILLQDERLELIEGEILCMSPIGKWHASRVVRLIRWFDRRVGDRALVSAQNPLRLSPYSEPQPDLMLLKPSEDFYASREVVPGDVLLLIEIADSSSAYDRRIKMPLYAQAGVPEAWLLDLQGQRAGVHREPSPDGYRNVEWYERGSTLTALAFPDLPITVDELLGQTLPGRKTPRTSS